MEFLKTGYKITNNFAYTQIKTLFFIKFVKNEEKLL